MAEPRYLRVRGWERFQHYRDRSPPWIKLYNDLLENRDFAKLPDEAKGQLIAIWLLASRSDNRIEYDPEWIKGRINATSPLQLDLLIEMRFLELDQVCSEPLAPGTQDASKALERVRAEQSRADARVIKKNGHDLTVTEPWAARVAEFKRDLEAGKKPHLTFWAKHKRNDWGPIPGDVGCHAPDGILAEAGFA